MGVCVQEGQLHALIEVSVIHHTSPHAQETVDFSSLAVPKTLDCTLSH